MQRRSKHSIKSSDFTQPELRFLKSLKSPAKIQAFLDRVPYHLANTAWSPRTVLENQSAHCLEGAIFAAAALRVQGYPPLLLDLEAVRDTSHVIAVYKKNGHWGAIASSNFASCRFRSPIYRTLRELALSYFEGYFNLRKERTLRAYSQPVDLSRFDKLHWMTTHKPVWFIVEQLIEAPHTQLISAKVSQNLTPVDKRSFEAGSYGRKKK